ncbi:uncharacterized protein LOC125760981 [Anopheles funestus]|uniref:uncharacterized protein LOC125760981 n=1 Tax=Anopheles funestus TaxID=62324 RepID=UPI0020C6675F|nr:uncharacterized protein LOC125760981 [Anopheles funestus]
MVEMLEKEPEIARALHKGDQTVFWETLAENVNALGPPVRQASVWKKVWFDFKCSVKKKLRENYKEATATGGGPNKQKILNELEERVADLTNLRATIQNFGRSYGNPQNQPIVQAEPCTSLVVVCNIYIKIF